MSDMLKNELNKLGTEIKKVPDDKKPTQEQQQRLDNEIAAKDCRTCQNMSCRVEQYEKPVEDCIGYIHHEEA